MNDEQIKAYIDERLAERDRKAAEKIAGLSSWAFVEDVVRGMLLPTHLKASDWTGVRVDGRDPSGAPVSVTVGSPERPYVYTSDSLRDEQECFRIARVYWQRLTHATEEA